MSKTLEQAELLRRKAVSDEGVLDIVLEHPTIGDDIFGFQCQQASEKLLKSLLSVRQVAFRHTHDLATLMELLADAGLTLPVEFDALKPLTIYAVAFRYADLPPQLTLERAALRELVRQLHGLVEQQIAMLK
jgi:hypothetical protein